MKCRRCGGWVGVMSASDVRRAITRCEKELADAKEKAKAEPQNEAFLTSGANAFAAGYAVATLERLEGQLAKLCDTCIKKRGGAAQGGTSSC